MTELDPLDRIGDDPDVDAVAAASGSPTATKLRRREAQLSAREALNDRREAIEDYHNAGNDRARHVAKGSVRSATRKYERCLERYRRLSVELAAIAIALRLVAWRDGDGAPATPERRGATLAVELTDYGVGRAACERAIERLDPDADPATLTALTERLEGDPEFASEHETEGGDGATDD